jgi:protein ImuA
MLIILVLLLRVYHMELSQHKQELIKSLKHEMLQIQGVNYSKESVRLGLGPLESAFPNAIFPTAALHEFIIAEPEHAAACGGFLAGILNVLMKHKGTCIWISRSRKLFPAALKAFGLQPERVIFIDLESEREVLWVMEEALKCKELVAVVAEVKEITFSQSRRLQLALENSKVTGFVLRTDAERISTTTCVARWKISPIESEQVEGLPGVGFPRWNIELLRVKNGIPGTYQLSWIDGKFQANLETQIAYPLKLNFG